MQPCLSTITAYNFVITFEEHDIKFMDNVAYLQSGCSDTACSHLWIYQLCEAAIVIYSCYMHKKIFAKAAGDEGGI